MNVTSDEIKELAKKRGLDIVEGAAGEAAMLAIDIVKLMVEKSETQVDDMVMGAVEGIVREQALKLVDKIDGEEG